MNSLTFVFLASPDLSGLWIAILQIGTLLPIFLLDAIHGQRVGLGVLQAFTLLSAEIIHWQLMRRMRLIIRIIGAIIIYFSLNFVFVLVFEFLWR